MKHALSPVDYAQLIYSVMQANPEARPAQLVGLCMVASQGKADPRQLEERIQYEYEHAREVLAKLNKTIPQTEH